MRARALTLTAAALALLLWLPLGLAGVPLDTPDGFLHLGWAAGWARQVASGDLWPQWTDLNWAGAGSFALAIYPPLFRLLVGLPLLGGVPPDQALAGALLVLLLLNNAGALALARLWLPAGRWRWLLLGGAAFNPYLLVNVFVRGAWPEALAQALLWWLALGWLGLQRRHRWGLPLAALALTGVILSNWNAALLTLILWALGAGALALGRSWSALGRWLAALLLALAASAPFWWPALQLLASLRQPIPAGLLPGEFFGVGAAGAGSFGRLLWIQSLAIALLAGARWLGWGRRSDGMGRWGLAAALLGLLLMLPLSQPLYGLLPPLQRIQFPWRWLGPAWLGVLLWLGSAAGVERSGERAAWRRMGLGLALAAALGCWLDGLWRFRSNLLGHAPSAGERQALRLLLACDPLRPCPAGLRALPAEGELAKRFSALPDGRVALAGVPDYSPAGIPEASWERRLQIFWLPAWPQASWARLSPEGRVIWLRQAPRQRWLQVENRRPGRLRLMQWAHPHWQVRWRRAESAGQAAGPWQGPLAAGGRDGDGWISVPLPAGRWEVLLRHP